LHLPIDPKSATRPIDIANLDGARFADAQTRESTQREEDRKLIVCCVDQVRDLLGGRNLHSNLTSLGARQRGILSRVVLNQTIFNGSAERMIDMHICERDRARLLSGLAQSGNPLLDV